MKKNNQIGKSRDIKICYKKKEISNIGKPIKGSAFKKSKDIPISSYNKNNTPNKKNKNKTITKYNAHNKNNYSQTNIKEYIKKKPTKITYDELNKKSDKRNKSIPCINNTNPALKDNDSLDEKIKNKNKIKSDIKNANFCEPLNNNMELNMRAPKLYTNTDNNKIGENIIKSDNMNYIPLYNVSQLYENWKKLSITFDVFEGEVLKKDDFEIIPKTLEIKTKNAESCGKLKDQEFWILYIEYLINKSLLVNESQFISVINEAFSYIESNCTLLRIYYLLKIKKYSPCFLPDGSLDYRDEVYFNKLNKSTANLIKRQKGILSSNVVLKRYVIKKNDNLIYPK